MAGRDNDSEQPRREPNAELTIRLTDDERIEFQKVAERCGLSLAAWARDRLREAAKREAKEA
jgi:predicted HicB family RNase H-like nuclease